MKNEVKTNKAIASMSLLLLTIFCFSAKAVTMYQPEKFGASQQEITTYLNEVLEYPLALLEEGYEVKVVVNFLVDTFGNVSNVELSYSEVRSDNKGQISPTELSMFETEALDAVRNMPKWSAAIMAGKSRPIQYSLPILFLVAA